MTKIFKFTAKEILKILTDELYKRKDLKRKDFPIMAKSFIEKNEVIVEVEINKND